MHIRSGLILPISAISIGYTGTKMYFSVLVVHEEKNVFLLMFLKILALCYAIFLAFLLLQFSCV